MQEDPTLRIGAFVHSKVTPPFYVRQRLTDVLEIERIGQLFRVRSKKFAKAGKGAELQIVVLRVVDSGKKNKVEMPLTVVKQGPDFTSTKGIPDREV